MRVAMGGYAIEAEWLGPPPDAAPVLVFLHDGLGSVSTWKRFPAEIVEATGLGALVYSRRGFTASRSPAPGSVKQSLLPSPSLLSAQILPP